MSDVATGELVGRPLAFPVPVRKPAAASDGRLVVGFGHEVAVLTRR